jgi:hypothetical protein
VDTVLRLSLGWLLVGAVVFIAVWLLRHAVRLASPAAEGSAAAKVIYRAVAVAAGVALGALGHASLFPELGPLIGSLLGATAGFGARDAWDAFGEARRAAKARALAAISGAGKEGGGA